MAYQTNDNIYAASRYIVDAAGNTPYTTIQAAVNAAHLAGGSHVIYVRDGTYVESITMYTGCSIKGNSAETVIISGNHEIMGVTGELTFQDVTLQHATATISSAAIGTANITLKGCIFNVTNGFTINATNWTGSFTIIDCTDNSIANGIVTNTSTANVEIISSTVGNATALAVSGSLIVENSNIGCPITMGAASVGLSINNSYVDGTITTAGAVISQLANVHIQSGVTPAITHNSANALYLYNITMDSSAVNVFTGTGAGIIYTGSISYLNSSEAVTTLFFQYMRGSDRISPFTVGATGNFATVNAAVYAAYRYANATGIVSTVYIQDGTYTENLTLYPKVNLKGNSVATCTISGSHNIDAVTGTVQYEGITFTHATTAFTSALAGTAAFNFINCHTSITNGHFITANAWAGQFLFENCLSTGTNDGIISNNAGNSVIRIRRSSLGYGSSGNALTLAANSCSIDNSVILCPMSLSGTVAMAIYDCRMTGSITTANTVAVETYNCHISTGAVAAITHNSAGTFSLSNVNITSTAVPPIQGTGAGVIYFGDVTYRSNSGYANTLSVSYTRSINRISPYVVGTTATYNTIQAAIDAAHSAGGVHTVYIQEGSYFENLTLYPWINLYGEGDGTVDITGLHTITGSGAISLTHVGMDKVGAGNLITVGGAVNLTFVIDSCEIIVPNGYFISQPTNVGEIRVYNTQCYSPNDGFITIPFNGDLYVFSSVIGGDLSTNNLTVAGLAHFFSSTIQCPITVSGNGEAFFYGCNLKDTLSLADNGYAFASACRLNPRATKAATTQSSATSNLFLANCAITSDQTPMCQGAAGNINFDSSTFVNSRGIGQDVAATLTRIYTSATFTGEIDALNIQSMKMTGFDVWDGAAPYYSFAGTNFTLIRGGYGYINSRRVHWNGAQVIAAMAQGEIHYVYIDNTGTVGSTTTWTEALYQNNIVLLEVLVDNTGIPVVTVCRENPPYYFQTSVGAYMNLLTGATISNLLNGAFVVKTGTKEIKISGADDLLDQGMVTVIPDSGGAAVTWNFFYLDATNKWRRYNAGTAFSSEYNNAGTITALPAGTYAAYRLYVCKDNANTATPQYLAIYNNAVYANRQAAYVAISNDNVQPPIRELMGLEPCQLGFCIKEQSSDTLTDVIVAKQTSRSYYAMAVGTTASLISTDVTGFTGWLTATDLTVQECFDTLDSYGNQVNNMLFVSKAGNDANSGKSPYNAKLTINNAVTAAAAGDTIIVYPGTYTETVTHAANNVTVIAMGKPETCIIGQVDANVINFNTRTGIQYKNFKIQCVNATTAINTITGSTGSINLKECHLYMASATNIVAVDQPAVASLTGAGTISVVMGKVFYYHTGACGATALKGAFKTFTGGLVDLKLIDSITVTNSGTALVSTLMLDASTTGTIACHDCYMTITDPNATLVVGLGYVGGTGTSHEFYRNEIHIVATANTSYGFFCADTASLTRTFYNHIHPSDTGGASYWFHVGNTATVISVFDDCVQGDGANGNQLVAGSLFYQTSKQYRGNLTCSGPTAAGTRSVTISNTSNTADASNAALYASVGGATSTGDPFVNFLVTGAGTYSVGIDNSDSDQFKITTDATPSAGEKLLGLSTSIVDIGTAGVAKTITIGNGTGATSVDIQSGTGWCNFGTNLVAHAVNVGNATGITSVGITCGTGGMTLTTTNSTMLLATGTGALNIGTDGVAHSITIGNSTGATAVDIQSGTGAINVGTNAIAHTVTVGNTTGASVLALKCGTGDFTLASATGTIMTALDTGAVTFGLGNVDITRSTAGAGTVSATISNTSNTADASNATLYLSVGGTTSTGDPFINFAVPGGDQFSLGQDNSDSDQLKLTTGATPSAATTLMAWKPSTGYTSAFNTVFQQIPTVVGGTAYLLCQNQDTTNLLSDSQIAVKVGAATAGDPYLYFSVVGAGAYSMGIDNSDSDQLKITSSIGPSAGEKLLGISTSIVDIGTAAVAKTITIGNGTGATSVDIQSGTGAINVGTNAIAHTVTVGNTTGASILALKCGTGDCTLASATGTIMTALDTGAVTFSLGNVDITRSTAGAGTVSATISNTDNTAVASNAALYLSVGGTTSTGDPFINFSVPGGNQYSMGLDNTSATDRFFITNGASPSAGTILFSINDTTSIGMNVLGVYSGTPTVGFPTFIDQRNDDNTNVASHSSILIRTGGASGGDPYLQMGIQAVAVYYSLGVDNSDSDIFKFVYGSGVSGITPIWQSTSAGAVSFLLGNVDITRSTAGAGTVSHTISNTYNVAAAADAALYLSVGGTTSTGDPFVNFSVPGGSQYSLGIDNTSAGDRLIISTGSSPSAGTTIVVLNGTTSMGFASPIIYTGYTVVGGLASIDHRNDDNTNAASHVGIWIRSGGSSGGDPYLTVGVQGATYFSMGVDNSAGDALKITSDAYGPSGGTLYMQTTTAGEFTFPLQPAFLAYNSANDVNQTGNGTAVTVDFDTEVFDQNADFAADTFTAPVTGIYRFSVTVRMKDLNAATSSLLQLITSARSYSLGYVNPTACAAGGAEFAFGGTTLADMTAGHTAYVRLTNNGAGADNNTITGSASPYDTFFSGKLEA